jgi:hypothetical protein
MTTLRDILTAKKRRVMSVVFFGFALCFVGVVVGSSAGSFPWIFLLGFAVAGGAMAYGYTMIKCPSCTTRIGYYVMYGGSPFTIPKNMNYCPSCGVKLGTYENQKVSGREHR